MQIVAAKILQTVARDARKEDLPDDVIMVSVVLYKPNWYYKIYGYKYMAGKTTLQVSVSVQVFVNLTDNCACIEGADHCV